jgi:cytochrome P450
LLMLGHPRHAQLVLVDRAANYTKDSPMWEPLRTLLGNGLLVSGGEHWMRQRRMMQPQFHRQQLVGMTALMSEAIEDELRSWDQAAKIGEEISPTEGFNALTMKVIVRALFGGEIEKDEIDSVSKNLTFILDFILQGIMAQSLPSWLPMPGRSRYASTLRQLDLVLHRIIQRGRAHLQSGTSAPNLLSLLLRATDEETRETMNDQQLRDETLTLFLAGYETTASALAWAQQFMFESPEVSLKLQAEVDAVLGQRSPTFADLSALPYARMILQESLRLRPPSWWTPRVALADDEIDGFTVKAGTTVAPITYVIHHHPEVWDDPHRFDPERFTPARSEARHRAAWIPFALGQHQCIGKEFAMMEAQLVLARLAQRYQISAGSGSAARPQLSATLRMQGGRSLRLSRRHK